MQISSTDYTTSHHAREKIKASIHEPYINKVFRVAIRSTPVLQWWRTFTLAGASFNVRRYWWEWLPAIHVGFPPPGELNEKSPAALGEVVLRLVRTKRLPASSCLSVCFSVCFHWPDFHEILYQDFFWNSTSEIKFCKKNLIRITCTLHEDLCTYVTIHRSILSRPGNASDKFYRENQYMKTYAHMWPYIDQFLVDREMPQTNFIEKINTWRPMHICDHTSVNS